MGWISVADRLPETDGKNTSDYNVLVYIPKRGGCRQHGIYVGSFWGLKTESSEWMVWSWGYYEHPVITHWMPLPAPPDKGNNVPIKAPNEPLTLDEIREMDGEPIYVTTKNYGDGWCILNWHGVNKSYTYFSRTGTSEGMTATPLSAKTYGDLWTAYRRPPEEKEAHP